MEFEIRNKIAAFDGSNFNNWKFRLHTLLDERDLSIYIENPLADILSKCTDAAEKAAVKLKEKKCKSLIIQCIADSHLEYVKDKTSAKEVYDVLVSTFERRSTSGQLYLRKKLLTLKCNEGDSMENHFLVFDKIVRELKSTGAKMEQSDVVCHLLITLPKSFDSVVTALETINPNNLTIEFVKSRLLDEGRKKTVGAGSGCSNSTDSVAMQSVKRKYQIKCFKCGKLGHKKFQCKSADKSYAESPKKQANWSSANGNELAFVAVGEQSDLTVCGATMVKATAVNATTIQTKSVQAAANVKKSNSGIANYSASKTMVWCVDSGATDHMVNSLEYFYSIEDLENPIEIAVAKSGVKLMATKIGTVKGTVHNGSECSVKNVLFVKDLSYNLFSIKRCEELGFKIVFDKATVSIMRENHVMAQGKRTGRLYELKFKYSDGKFAAVSKVCDNINIWHRRLGHLNQCDVFKLINNRMVIGVENLPRDNLSFCEPCVEGKQRRLAFGEIKESRTSRPLELIHSDVCGPITPNSWNGKRYVVTFIDDYTHFAVIYVIKGKDEVFEAFKEYEAISTVHFGKNISRFRCDNGGEYLSNEFKNFCKAKGIQLKYTVAYTPQQNGVAERYNRTLIEKARTMIMESKMSKSFWSEAVLAAVYTANRSPSRALKESRVNCTPAELWYGKKPDISNLRVFGCDAYAHVPKELRKKLDSKTKKCIMVGYGVSGYRLWDPERRQIIMARDVIFNENFCRDIEIDECVSAGEEDIVGTPGTVTTKREIIENKVSNMADDDGAAEAENDVDNNIDEREEEIVAPPERDDNIFQYLRPRKNVKYTNVAIALSAESFVDDVPRDFSDARKRSDWNDWKAAIEEEMKSLKKNNTWTETTLPNGRQPISCKWIFKIKRDEDGNISRYKARLVARGFQQKREFDYNETYAPVAKLTTLRIMLAVANQRGMFIHQMDVKTAFLNGHLKEEIYMKLPDGFQRDKVVVKLNRSLYGLKQASRAWNERFHNYVTQLHFKRTNADYCLYVKETAGCYFYLLLYVDDLVLMCTDLGEIKKIKAQFASEFDMVDMCEMKYFLGIKIERDIEKRVMKLSQKHYLLNVLKRFGMDDCKGSATPMEVGLSLLLRDGNGGVVGNGDGGEPYRELVGCLMYAMLASRPDLCAAVGYFSRFQSNYTVEHYNYLKRVLRYIKETVDMKLVYTHDKKEVAVCGYADADWANDVNDRKSTSGYVFFVFGCCVSWLSRKQATVSLSSTEAEYIALSTATCESIWINSLLNEINIVNKQTIIFEDNQACIKIAEEPREHKRMKHIDIKYNFIREVIRDGKLKVIYVNTNDQLADLMTKPLPRLKFNYLRTKIGCLIEEEC